MRNKVLFLTVLLLTLTGCPMLVEESGQEEVLTLEVAADSVPCVGEMIDMCIQVRAPGEATWRKFYDPIEGFVPEAGTMYTLEVGRTRIDHPPADGSAFRYRLIRVLHQEVVGSPGS